MDINRKVLANGLTLLHKRVPSTQMVTLNVLYRVGSRNETSGQTGFAHLFEHLMFGGSVHIPNFDKPLQDACGDNNAYTTPDYTNYFITLPVANIETAFWLESDRMLSLAFTPQSLEVQRKVVMEEFKMNYLNQPYGDVGHLLSALSYPKGHPYSWPTIGLELSHIADATMDDVHRFYDRYYCPSNAIVSVVGNISWEQTEALAEKWFGDIEKPQYTEAVDPCGADSWMDTMGPRRQVVKREVPNDLLVMSFPLPRRMDPDFHACDMITDVLSNGRSSRFYHQLVEQEQLFVSLDAYVSPRIGPGLLIVEGVPNQGVTIEQAEEAVWKQMERLATELVPDMEIEKQKNKYEYTQAMDLIDARSLAAKLCTSEMLGDVQLFDADRKYYMALTAEDIQRVARRYVCKERGRVLHYLHQ